MNPAGRVSLRCYSELNDRLPPGRRQRDCRIPITGGTTVGDLIAGVGIPAEAVEVALVNGRSETLERVLRDGDRLSLYPVFESFDVTPLLRLRPRPLRQVRFGARFGKPFLGDPIKQPGAEVLGNAERRNPGRGFQHRAVFGFLSAAVRAGRKVLGNRQPSRAAQLVSTVC